MTCQENPGLKHCPVIRIKVGTGHSDRFLGYSWSKNLW